jgi:hypothetical protein
VSIGAMQRTLERALARAREADDRELAGRVREEGQRLVFLTNGLLRASRLYAGENAALDGPAAEIARILVTLLELLGSVHLVCVEDQVYVNDVRLRPRPSEQDVIAHLIAELDRHDVGGVSFHMPLDATMIKSLARAFADPPADPTAPRAALFLRLAPTVPLVELTGRYRFRVKGERAPVRRSHAEVLRTGAQVAREAFANLAAGRLPNPLPVRRAVIDLVDGLKEDPDLAARAPLSRREHGVAEHHLLAVTSLAVSLGLALKLPEAELSDLGVAAMLHDVGYAKAGTKDGHPGAGVRLLARQRGFHEGKLRRLMAVAEHHMTLEQKPGLFARILRIADDYDVLTAPRPGQPQVPPATAQAAMWAARGSAYDPDLMALFVQRMGLYPPGSLLELSDGRLVVSVSGGRGRDRFAWPLVRVVRNPDGSAGGNQPLDLYETREAARPKKVVNPASLGLDPGQVLEQGPQA